MSSGSGIHGGFDVIGHLTQRGVPQGDQRLVQDLPGRTWVERLLPVHVVYVCPDSFDISEYPRNQPKLCTNCTVKLQLGCARLGRIVSHNAAPLHLMKAKEVLSRPFASTHHTPDEWGGTVMRKTAATTLVTNALLLRRYANGPWRRSLSGEHKSAETMPRPALMPRRRSTLQSEHEAAHHMHFLSWQVQILASSSHLFLFASSSSREQQEHLQLHLPCRRRPFSFFFSLVK